MSYFYDYDFHGRPHAHGAARPGTYWADVAYKSTSGHGWKDRMDKGTSADPHPNQPRDRWFDQSLATSPTSRGDESEPFPLAATHNVIQPGSDLTRETRCFAGY